MNRQLLKQILNITKNIAANTANVAKNIINRNRNRSQRTFKLPRSKNKKSRFVVVLTLIFGCLTLKAFNIHHHTQTHAADPPNPADASFTTPANIPACGGNSECFAFTIDTRLTSTGETTGTDTDFIIPSSGQVNNTDSAYRWIINWGDGNEETRTGFSTVSSNYSSSEITHNYTSPGQYQITIRPSATAASGWLDAFGFLGFDYTGGSAIHANAASNKDKFRSINTPFTDLMRTQGTSHRFAYIFWDTRNNIGIPTGLFGNISTANNTNFDSIFRDTFNNSAYNSTDAIIPSGLFDTLNTTQGTSFNSMFNHTFANYADKTTVGTIPAGLFDFLNTAQATNFSQMFSGTFSDFAVRSTTPSLPTGLFNSLDTARGTDFSSMFHNTFYSYAVYTSYVNISIPAGLFDFLNTAQGTNFSRMFAGTFYRFASFANLSTAAAIPPDFFKSLNTGQGTNFTEMFLDTFRSYAVGSHATIPDGLFDTLSTSKCTDFSSLFSGTFRGYASFSDAGIIPPDLFKFIDTSQGTNFTRMFHGTFESYAQYSNSATIPAGLFSPINTSQGTNFNGMFYGTFNNFADFAQAADAIIPPNLFSSIDTSKGVNFYSMFASTFNDYAGNSAAEVNIPAGLFSYLDTSQGTNFGRMFTHTFASYLEHSMTTYIPAGLFSSLDTSRGTDFNGMFYSTFRNFASSSRNNTIPAGLFSAINTSQGTNFKDMFAATFAGCSRYSYFGAIPTDLFSFLDTSRGTNFNQMFYDTFHNYTRRSAKFIVNGSVVYSSEFREIYNVKIGLNGTPSDDPTVAAGDKIYPSYNSTARTITAPSSGPYSAHTWFTKDGTSCAVANPTKDCGVQEPSNFATLPDSARWAPSVSTEPTNNATFYGVFVPSLDLALSSSSLAIDSSTGAVGSLVSASHTASVHTNSLTGYRLSVSTNQPDTNPRASDLAHQTAAGVYLPATANTCSWNATTDIFTNTNNPLSVNSWGFTLDAVNLNNQKLCKMPSLSQPLTIKRTTKYKATPDDTTVYYGTKLNLSQPAGNYRTTMTYTVTSNP
jgi:hypothetical protein